MDGAGNLAGVGSEPQANSLHYRENKAIRKIWIALLAATTLGAGVVVSFASSGGETATARTAQPAVTTARAPLSMAGPVLVALSSHEMVNIGRGENGGRTVSYTNVVVDEFAAGRWTGGKQSITLRAAQLKVPGADRYALILRRGAGRTIIGSALI